MKKKRILFLTPYPQGTAPSQRFRFEQYIDTLEKDGFVYDYKSFLDEKTWEILYKPGLKFQKIWGIIKGFAKRKLLMLQLKPYDYVFIHREVSPIGPPIFEWWIANIAGKKIIYDFDDAIWLANTSSVNRLVAGIKWHHKVGQICKWAYKVSCGNHYLSNYAAKYQSEVVYNPTTIDTEYMHNPVLLPIKEVKEKPIIGWTGSHSTGQYLQILVKVLQRLEEEYDFEFLVISNKNPELPLKNWRYIDWDAKTEIPDLAQFDIGVMPLTDDQWSRGKCGFKALQYMALGIPALVSPVPPNDLIVDHGINGFYCRSEEEWYDCLKNLLGNPGQLKGMKTAARDKIINNYSVLSNTANFQALFS